MGEELQLTPTVISKTAQVAIGSEINVINNKRITFFFDYVKGDETGVDIIVYTKRKPGDTARQAVEWTGVGGVYTPTAVKYRLTASGNYPLSLDLEAVNFVSLTQGGSNNDGTPTGTLAVTYSVK